MAYGRKIKRDIVKEIWEAYKKDSSSATITYGNILAALERKEGQKSLVFEKMRIWCNKYPLDIILDRIHTYSVLNRRIALIELKKQKDGIFFRYSDLRSYYGDLAEKKKRAIQWRHTYSQIWNDDTLSISYYIKKRMFSKKDDVCSLKKYMDNENKFNLNLNRDAKRTKKLEQEIKQGKFNNNNTTLQVFIEKNAV